MGLSLQSLVYTKTLPKNYGRNLRKLFGDAFIDFPTLLWTDKDEILEELSHKYYGAPWIEDKPERVGVVRVSIIFDGTRT